MAAGLQLCAAFSTRLPPINLPPSLSLLLLLNRERVSDRCGSVLFLQPLLSDTPPTSALAATISCLFSLSPLNPVWTPPPAAIFSPSSLKYA